MDDQRFHGFNNHNACLMGSNYNSNQPSDLLLIVAIVMFGLALLMWIAQGYQHPESVETPELPLV